MSLAAALLLASAMAQPGGADTADSRGGGAQTASAKVAVTILQPAILRGGVLVSDVEGDAPTRVQRLRRETRVTYEFE